MLFRSKTCNEYSTKYSVPVVNKRISVTPISYVGAGFNEEGFVKIAEALDLAATKVGIDLIGGYSANVEKGVSNSDLCLINALPSVLSKTQKVNSSITST